MAERILGPTGGGRRSKRLLLIATVTGLIIIVAALVTGGSVFAAPSTDASVSEYSQCANDKPPSTSTACPQKWINGILNANNSHYHEDQVTAQRLFLDLPRNGPVTLRTVILKYLARKGQGGVGNHAYDSLAQWNFTQTTADRCQDVLPANCPGGTESKFTIPVDNTLVADSNGSPGASTATHELPDANRYISMFGGTITGVTAPVHDNASGSGDDYASIKVTYSVASTPAKVELLFGGHLAAAIGPRGWGSNVGSSFINGGPYHIKLVQVDTSSVGNRDNQITSGAILPTGTTIQTALHETDSNGADVSPANNQDPLTQTGITVNLPSDGSGANVVDYATVAPSGSTGTVDFRYYSTLAACQAGTNASEGGTAAGTGKTLTSDVAKSDTITFTSTGTIYWRAFFQGTSLSLSSSSGCSEEILLLNQNTSTSTELHQTDSGGTDVDPANNALTITVPVGAYVTDVATVTPGSATGSVAFKYYGTLDNCNSDVSGTAAGGGSVSSGSASSDAVQFSTSGTFYWRAFFTGTNSNNNSSSACNEILTVNKSTPGVATFPTLRPQDKATMSSIVGGGTGTMSLTFTLYGPDNPTCLEGSGLTHVFQQTVTVTANGDYSTTNATFVLDSSSPTGVYNWKVDFVGDTANNDVTGGCGDESFDLGAGGIVDKSS